MKISKWIGFGMVLMAIGCMTPKINTSWKAEKTVPQKYNRIMVLGLNREVDRSIQMNMEIHLAGDLQDLGYCAVSSLQEYGPKAFDNMDEEAALAKLKNSGVDVVITMVLLDKGKERNYIPGNTPNSPGVASTNNFWGYRTASYNLIHTPGYYVNNTQYFWESNFYDLSTQKLVYSMQTLSFDPVNSVSLGHHNGQTIIKNIVKNRILIRTEDLATKSF